MDFFSEAAGNTANFSDEYKKEIIQLVKNAEIEKTKMVLPIEVGNKADITLFVPNKKWTFEKELVFSSTYNSDLIGKELTGFVAGVVNNSKFALKD